MHHTQLWSQICDHKLILHQNDNLSFWQFSFLFVFAILQHSHARFSDNIRFLSSESLAVFNSIHTALILKKQDKFMAFNEKPAIIDQ